MVNQTTHTRLDDAAGESEDAVDAIDAKLAERKRSQDRAQCRAIIGSLRQALAADDAHLNRLRYRERELREGPEELMIRGGQRIKIRKRADPDAADAMRPEIAEVEARVQKIRDELALHLEMLKDYE